MLQLQNETPFPANIVVFPDPRGVETLYVTVRAAFRLAGMGLAVAEEQRPLQLADEYAGDPARSSLTRAGEVHLSKPGTDVVLIGEAFAPRSRPATSVDVSLRVGPVAKTVRVFGDRAWVTGASDRISSPEPFVRMPLAYERAFGGVLELDPDTNRTTLDPRNPAGVGFARVHGAISRARSPTWRIRRTSSRTRATGRRRGVRVHRALVGAAMPVRGHVRQSVAADARALPAGRLRPALLPRGAPRSGVREAPEGRRDPRGPERQPVGRPARPRPALRIRRGHARSRAPACGRRSRWRRSSSSPAIGS